MGAFREVSILKVSIPVGNRSSVFRDGVQEEGKRSFGETVPNAGVKGVNGVLGVDI
jgi:hypothetical protein